MPFQRRSSPILPWVAAVLASIGYVLSPFPARGASYHIEIWESERGLPQNSVFSLVEGDDGYLWLGTLNGLVRFDGARFTVFDERNTPGLASGQILHLFEDSDRNLFLGTEADGLLVARAGQVERVESLRVGRENRVLASCEDEEGAVWMFTSEGQLHRYHRGRVSGFTVGIEPLSQKRLLVWEKGRGLWIGTDRFVRLARSVGADASVLPIELVLPLSQLDFLLASSSGGYWRLAERRIQRWSGTNMVSDFGSYPWGTTPVSAACEDAEGRLVVGTQGAGVFWQQEDGAFAQLTTTNGLSHHWILSVLVDRNGNLWVGTDGGGLNRVRRQVFHSVASTQGIVVQSACKDSDGGVWLGSNGRGAGHWAGGELRWFGPAEGLKSPFVRSVYVDGQKRVWVGTRGAGLFLLQDGRFVSVAAGVPIHPEVHVIFEDRSGVLWFGTEGGLVRWDGNAWRVYRARDGLFSEKVQAIAEGVDGEIWVGTERGGLYRFQEGTFTVYSRREGLPSEDITSLCFDSEGVLWAGTRGGGLARLENGKWTTLSTQEGLTSNRIGFLAEDGLGFLWIGSQKGLMRVPTSAMRGFAEEKVSFVPCRVFGSADGLPSAECSSGGQPAALRTEAGRMYFSTIKGLAWVNPADIEPNLQPPQVVVESVLVDGQLQGRPGLRPVWPEQIVLPPGPERVELQFASLNLAAPERARFRYRMAGLERDWTDAGTSRVARYTRLPPGEYRFLVTAANEEGVWNEQAASIAFLVQTPLWRKPAFLVIAPLVLLGLIVAGVHYASTQRLQRQLEGMRQHQALEKERSRIARDLHDQLGASLTRISLLGELTEADREEPDEVSEHARQISQTSRETTRVLDEIVWAVNPSNDTLEGLVNYICKYAQEYLEVADVKYRLEAPPSLPQVDLPPEVRHNVFLAAKEAITNIVRHAHASSAWVRLRVQPESFELEIADNGRGAMIDPKAAETRNGLRNMRRRMEDAGGEFWFGRSPEGGAMVRLTAPLRSRPGAEPS